MIIEKGERLVAINRVVPYGQNPKIHSDKQIKLLAEHIREVGFDTPIVVDEELVIIKGHARLAALKYLGSKQALVKVRKGLTEAQKKAARIADNKLAELATDHEEYLRVELKELAALEVDLKSLGFDNIRLTELKIDLLGMGDGATPDFEPGTEEDQGKIDQVKLLVCPKCGEEFETAEAKTVD